MHASEQEEEEAAGEGRTRKVISKGVLKVPGFGSERRSKGLDTFKCPLQFQVVKPMTD